jgi:hypothetical protein
MRRDRSAGRGRIGVDESVWWSQGCVVMETVAGAGGHTQIRPDGQVTGRVSIMGLLKSMPVGLGQVGGGLKGRRMAPCNEKMDQTD